MIKMQSSLVLLLVSCLLSTTQIRADLLSGGGIGAIPPLVTPSGNVTGSLSTTTQVNSSFGTLATSQWINVLNTANPIAPIYLPVNITSRIQLQYIVQLRASSNTTFRDSLLAQVNALGSSTVYSYSKAFIGFTIKINSASLLSSILTLLQQTADVLTIEQDASIYQFLYDQSSSSLVWGLDRVDQRATTGDKQYHYNNTAPSVNAYIIDTGIRKTHVEFQGRALHGYGAFNATNSDDGNGHGTWCAGQIGSATYGVAKGSTLYAVKVLQDDGSGTSSSVISGIDWVINNAVFPAVASMSLGGSASSSVDSAVGNGIQAGIPFVVAAGNSNISACDVSPARTNGAITVGASDITDTRAYFSNWGTCVDIFASGVSLLGVWATSDTATNVLSGTSMATPNVAGVVALYLQRNPQASPARISHDLVCSSTKGAVSDLQGSPNTLAFSFVGVDTSTSVKNTSTNDVSESCTDATGASVCTSVSGSITNGNNNIILIPSNGYTTNSTGFHRGWLSSQSSGTNLLNQPIVTYLYFYKMVSGQWSQVSSATQSSASQSLYVSDSQVGGGTYAWGVQANGFTPETYTLTYKLPQNQPQTNSTNFPAACAASKNSVVDYSDPYNPYPTTAQPSSETSVRPKNMFVAAAMIAAAALIKFQL